MKKLYVDAKIKLLVYANVDADLEDIMSGIEIQDTTETADIQDWEVENYVVTDAE
jgi:hypothetical protein